MKSSMCNLGTSCWMVRYVYVDDASNSSMFSVKMMWNSGGLY